MRTALVAVTLGLTLTGCARSAASREGRTAGDCTQQVRWNDVIYDGLGQTDKRATRLGIADQAECHDTGTHPEGSVFTDDAEQVAVWEFEGYSTNEVVGVRFDPDTFAVLVAESVPGDRAEQILNALRKPG